MGTRSSVPLALADRKTLRLVVLCALYVAQGIPYGFVTVTLAAHLAHGGADTGAVGNLVALTMLPWAFKWVWAPFVDRFSRSTMGRRRPWILGAQAMMVLTASALVAFPELREDLTLLGWMVFAQNVFASMQDVSVDALAVDLLPEHERGFANGLMYGGSYLGTMFGGAALSIVLGAHGLRAALLAEVFALAAIMMLPLLFREHPSDRVLSLRSRPDGDGPGSSSMLGVARNLTRAFARRSPLIGAALALTVQLGANALAAMFTILLMQRLSWTQEDYGQMVGGLPLLLGLGGSVAGGWLADRLGHRGVIAASSILLGALWIGFATAQPLWATRSVIVGFACAQELLLGVLTASLFALFMDVSWPRVAATQFTAYMALMNLGRTLGSKLAGPVYEALGTAASFMVFGALQIALVLLLVPLDPHQNRRELGDGATGA